MTPVMSEEIRLFVAATLPGKLKAFLQEQSQAYTHPSIRLVPEQNLHLTFFFIGNTARAMLPSIKEAVQHIAAEHNAFNLQYLCTEPGPNPRSPRLVWTRFVQHPEFEKLTRKLAHTLQPEQDAKHKPIPHITLARFKKDASKPDLPILQQPDSRLSLPVTSVSLWQSELASPHPVYTVLETYTLAAKP